MHTILRVRRFNPESPNPAPYDQEYVLDLEPSETVLDGLLKIRETVDDSLTLRCSCRGAICGSCGMRINGHAMLACKTKIVTVAPQGGLIRVEPMSNMPVIKDLVTDMEPFWQKIRRVEPWLQPDGPPPEAEYVVPPAAMQHLTGVMACIMCGVCVSDCTVWEVDSTFLGPAALAKAYRFVADPRDAATMRRLLALNQPTGMWDCTRCMECVEVCPKHVAPMDRIMALRAKGMTARVPSTCGSRHAEVFTDIIRQKGRLDEPLLAVKTLGLRNWGRLLSMLPLAIQSFIHRKLPPSGPLHRAIPGIRSIRRIFARVEKRS